jgi:hypothetical protein
MPDRRAGEDGMSWWNSSRVLTAVAAVAFLAGPVLLSGQTGVATGSIEGFVLDPSGSPVAGARVRARALATGAEREAVSGPNGFYLLPYLPLDSFDVTVEAPGFAVWKRMGVQTRLGQSVALEARLELSAVQQVVEVSADAPLVRLEAAVQSELRSGELRNLPLTSRNVYNLALLAPGLTGRRDDEFGTTQFAFGGIARRGFMVDGVDNTQRGGQFRLGVFSPESISSIQVIHNAMSAEYGRTLGGIVNMATRGGSNEWHGAFLGLVRRPGLMARPSLASAKPFQQWAVWSGQFSGPLIRDRLFFFSSGEYQPIDAPRPITISPANAASLGLPASELGSAPFAQRFQTWLGRLDYQIHSRHSGFLRYGFFRTPSRYNTSGGLMPLSASNDFRDRQGTGVFQLVSTLSPAWLNELRYGDSFRRFVRPPVSGVIGPVANITGVATLLSNTSAGQYYLERQNQIVDNVTLRTSSHAVKAGVDLARIHVRQFDRLALTYTFATISDYLAASRGERNPANGRPSTQYVNLVQQFGDNSASHTSWSLNFFLQDDWRMSRNFTLNLGIRYENVLYPEWNSNAAREEVRRIPGDNNNWAPRVGLAWFVRPGVVVRGGYGLFYDTLNLRLISAAIRGDGVRVRTYRVAGAHPLAPAFPGGFTAPPEDPALAVTPSLFGFDPAFRTYLAHQSNAQVEWSLGQTASLTVGVQYYAPRRGPIVVDDNLVPSGRVLDDGRPVYSNVRLDRRFNQVQLVRSVSNGYYTGGFLLLQQRLGRTLVVQASYTAGQAKNWNDSTGDTGSPVSDPSNWRRDYGLSSADNRHRLAVHAVLTPQWKGRSLAARMASGWMIAPSFSANTGFPVNVVAGTDLNGDLVNNDRPLFVPRNSVRGPAFRELNLRLSRTFILLPERLRLEVMAEAENLLNSTNAACGIGGCTAAVVNRFGAADFGRITSALNSRQIQLGGRITF